MSGSQPFWQARGPATKVSAGVELNPPPPPGHLGLLGTPAVYTLGNDATIDGFNIMGIINGISQTIPGRIVQIAVDPRIPALNFYGVNRHNQLFLFFQVPGSIPWEWSSMVGSVTRIAVAFSGDLWMLDANAAVNGGYTPNKLMAVPGVLLKQWMPISGGLVEIAVGKNINDLWGINDKNQIFKGDGNGNWQWYSKILGLRIAVDLNHDLPVVISTDNRLYILSGPTSTDWIPYPGIPELPASGIKEFSLSFRDIASPYVIGLDGILYSLELSPPN